MNETMCCVHPSPQTRPLPYLDLHLSSLSSGLECGQVPDSAMTIQVRVISVEVVEQPHGTEPRSLQDYYLREK